jgi:hypothetical protein
MPNIQESRSLYELLTAVALLHVRILPKLLEVDLNCKIRPKLLDVDFNFIILSNLCEFDSNFRIIRSITRCMYLIHVSGYIIRNSWLAFGTH